MDTKGPSRTVELIGEARRIRDRATKLKEELAVTRAEVQETVRFVHWWRYMDYNAEATRFLDNLDMRPASNITESPAR